MRLKTTSRWFALAVMLTMSGSVASANDNGKAGRTSRLGEGCGDCHGVNASAATSVIVQDATGPIEMSPGSSRQFTVVVAHATQKAAGVNIAVRTAEDGGTNAGTLTAGANVRLKGTTGELTHAEPVPMNSGSVGFTFTWTAPEQSGTFYIQAIGNACNADGVEDAQDSWAWMTPVQIIVRIPTGVADDEAGATALTIAPSPLRVGAPATISGLSAGTNDVTIMDIHGRIVHREQIVVATSTDHRPLSTDSNAPFPPGVYAVTVTNGVRVVRSTIVIE